MHMRTMEHFLGDSLNVLRVTFYLKGTDQIIHSAGNGTTRH